MESASRVTFTQLLYQSSPAKRLGAGARLGAHDVGKGFQGLLCPLQVVQISSEGGKAHQVGNGHPIGCRGSVVLELLLSHQQLRGTLGIADKVSPPGRIPQLRIHLLLELEGSLQPVLRGGIPTRGRQACCKSNRALISRA
jgi:hypothetical protein